jgi:hypothetical protein
VSKIINSPAQGCSIETSVYVASRVYKESSMVVVGSEWISSMKHNEDGLLIYRGTSRRLTTIRYCSERPSYSEPRSSLGKRSIDMYVPFMEFAVDGRPQEVWLQYPDDPKSNPWSFCMWHHTELNFFDGRMVPRANLFVKSNFDTFCRVDGAGEDIGADLWNIKSDVWWCRLVFSLY